MLLMAATTCTANVCQAIALMSMRTESNSMTHTIESIESNYFHTACAWTYQAIRWVSAICRKMPACQDIAGMLQHKLNMIRVLCSKSALRCCPEVQSSA